jgi:hypothetical protein
LVGGVGAVVAGPIVLPVTAVVAVADLTDADVTDSELSNKFDGGITKESLFKGSRTK